MLLMKTEMLIRLGAFRGVFIALAVAEVLVPRRKRSFSRVQRWFINLTIVALNPLSVALIFPILPVGLALLASEQHWGLLNQLAMPYWLKVVIGVVMLDFVIYTQHVLFHAIPILWRAHMAHHADLDFDLTTGLRFHPFEIIISMGIQAGGRSRARRAGNSSSYLRGGLKRNFHVQPQ